MPFYGFSDYAAGSITFKAHLSESNGRAGKETKGSPHRPSGFVSGSEKSASSSPYIRPEGAYDLPKMSTNGRPRQGSLRRLTPPLTRPAVCQKISMIRAKCFSASLRPGTLY